jgi:hypothetical protein
MASAGMITLVRVATWFARETVVLTTVRGLEARELTLCERSVTNLLQRYEELVSLHLLDRPRLIDRLVAQGRAVLAIDGAAARCGPGSAVGHPRVSLG